MVIVLVFLPVIGWTKGIVTYGQYAFALTNSAILQYDRTSQSLVQKIGFFGKPLGIDSSSALLLLTTRGVFKANALTGQFTDIFPLYEYPQAMFCYKNSLDLLTQNELMVFDIVQKMKVKFSIFLEPAKRIPAFAAHEGRLFLAKQEGGLEIFEESKRQLKMLPFPPQVTKIAAAGTVLYGAGKKEVFCYDWKKGKVLKRMPVSEPIVDIAQAGNFLVASTNGMLFVIDSQKWQVVKKEAAGGWCRLAIENNQLYASAGNRVRVFTLPGLEKIQEQSFPETVQEVLFEAQTGTIAALSDGRLYFGGGTAREQPVVIPEPPTVAPVVSADSLFAIQVGAFGSKTSADNLGSTLNKKGIAYYIVEDKGVFKVRIGYFNSKQEAQIASGGLNDYKPWIARDKAIDTIKSPVGFDLNKDGSPEWVMNSEDRVVIFSLEKNIYKKAWESPADKKLKVTGVEDGRIAVETPEGTKGAILWSGKNWELRF
jgi:hypothetical protein